MLSDVRFAEPQYAAHRKYAPMTPLKRVLVNAVLSCTAFLMTAVAHADARKHVLLDTLAPESSDVPNSADDYPQADFGAAIAVQGETALIGMPTSQSPSKVLESGRVGVFTYSNNQWHRTGTLFASKPTQYAHFGRSIVLQGDTALIGSNTSVFVFRRLNGTWHQVQKVNAPSSDGVTKYPVAMAMYSDTAVVSAFAGTEGFVYVYQLQSNGLLKWSARVRSPTADPSEEFASAVDTDRGWLVVGAPSKLIGPQNAGAAYVFHRVNGQWRFIQKIIPNNGGVGDRFGASVAMDNYTIVVGAPYHDPEFDNEALTGAGGAAYVYIAHGGPFVESAVLRPTGEENPGYATFGEQVAITSDRIIASASHLEADYPHYPDRFVFTYIRYSALNEVLGVASGLIEGEGMAVDQHQLFVGDRGTDAYSGGAIGAVKIFDLVHRLP